MTNFNAPIPILRSFDAALMQAFYIDYLGFEITFSHRFAPKLPLYVEVRRDDCVIHLSEHNGDTSPGGALRIPMEDVSAFCAALIENDNANVTPTVKSQPFGWDDMTLADPFGNKLTFCTEHPA